MPVHLENIENTKCTGTLYVEGSREMNRGQNTSMVYAVSNISSIFRWLIKGFSERSPVNPQSSQRPIHGSRQTKGASAEADQMPKFGNPTQRISR